MRNPAVNRRLLLFGRVRFGHVLICGVTVTLLTWMLLAFAVVPMGLLWAASSATVIVAGTAAVLRSQGRYVGVNVYPARVVSVESSGHEGWRGEVAVDLGDGRIGRLPVATDWWGPRRQTRVALEAHGRLLQNGEPPLALTRAVLMRRIDRYGGAGACVACGAMFAAIGFLPD